VADACERRIPLLAGTAANPPDGRGILLSWPGRGGGPVTQNYLIGELSARLERLQATAGGTVAGEVTRLRHQVETSPPSRLTSAAAQALRLADDLCWLSLASGDAAAFAQQARLAAELREFSACARLLTDCQPLNGGREQGRTGSGGSCQGEPW
jgi:hypothetical protein